MSETYSYAFQMVPVKRYCCKKAIVCSYLFFYSQVKYLTCETRINNGFDWIQAMNRASWVSYVIVMPISFPSQGKTIIPPIPL